MNDKSTPAGLLRRLASIVYDSLLLCGVLFLASLPLPLIGADARQLWWVHLSIQAYLMTVCILFYCGFWVHGGQTLGMRSWRLKVVQPDGSPLTWRSALIRFFTAILSWAALGLGFLWVLIDKQQLAWHDRLSNSRLTVMPRQPPK